jgi:hypothetical protein
VLAEPLLHHALDGRSSPTSNPAAIVRLTCAPSLVWCWTFHRKISPTAMCSRSKSPASSFA